LLSGKLETDQRGRSITNVSAHVARQARNASRIECFCRTHKCSTGLEGGLFIGRGGRSVVNSLFQQTLGYVFRAFEWSDFITDFAGQQAWPTIHLVRL